MIVVLKLAAILVYTAISTNANYNPNSTFRGLTRNIDMQDMGCSNGRDYLNGLMKASICDKNQTSNIAFVKTHKTGSQTLSLLVERYGHRHGLKVAHYPGYKVLPIRVAADQILEECNGRVDVMMYHLGSGSRLESTWTEVQDAYRKIMTDPENINFVTILREPREHMISYYYYFLENITKISITDFWLNHEDQDAKLVEKMSNNLAGELGMRTIEDVEKFVSSALQNFKLVMLTEAFDEGLLILRRLFGWHNTAKSTISTTVRDGREIHEKPMFDDLPKSVFLLFSRKKHIVEFCRKVQVMIDEHTVLDRALYDAGKAAWRQALDRMAKEVQDDLIVFNKLQAIVQTYLECNKSSTAVPLYLARGLYHAMWPVTNDFF